MMKNAMNGSYIKNGESFDFIFYTELSAANKINFVDSMVELLVNDEHYNCIIRDLIFDFCIVDVFTDVDTYELKQSDFFLDDVEQFLDETRIADIVKENVPQFVFDELNKAIDNSVAYLTGIHVNPFNEALASLVNVIEKKISDIDLDNMKSVAKELFGMLGDITPESVVNAYMESGEHKANVISIAEAKKHSIVNDEYAEDISNAEDVVVDVKKTKTTKQKNTKNKKEE